jgi:hypothetical protein
MQKEPDCVTVEVIPLGLARVEPHIPVPIAFAGAIEIALSPLTISRNARNPNPAFLGLKTGARCSGIQRRLVGLASQDTISNL